MRCDSRQEMKERKLEGENENLPIYLGLSDKT